MYARVCARQLCVSGGRKREEGWVVTPWKSGDNASALNPPSFRREGWRRMGEGGGCGDTGVKEEESSSDLSVWPVRRAGMLCKI